MLRIPKYKSLLGISLLNVIWATTILTDSISLVYPAEIRPLNPWKAAILNFTVRLTILRRRIFNLRGCIVFITCPSLTQLTWGFPDICFHHDSYFFCEIGRYAKFQNTRPTYSWKKIKTQKPNGSTLTLIGPITSTICKFLINNLQPNI